MANCKDCIHYGICTFHITGNENEKCTHYTPTADVVPKSEVEKLKADLIVWKQDRFNLYQRLELYEITRQKVAREIFGEIEKTVFADMDFFKELKKKYTENME